MDFAGFDGVVELSEVIAKHGNDVVKKQLLFAFHEVATFLELNRKDGVLLLWKFETPNGHYFFDLKSTVAELCAVHNPFSVSVRDVVDCQFELVGTHGELVDEG